MMTWLQTLLLETLPAETDPILRTYIETVLPAMEREFGELAALGGAFENHYQLLMKLGSDQALEKAQRWANRPDQGLVVHVLNALLTAWNISEFLAPPLTELEKRLLCLGITLHDYNKYCNGQGETSPKAYEISEILTLCQDLGEKLSFNMFWPEWRHYLSEIGFLAQNTQYKVGSNPIPSNWPGFSLPDSRRLKMPLRHLLAFGDVAVHLGDPAEIITVKAGNKSRSSGDALREHLQFLGINQKLIYHRLRDSLGILTNGIHNAVLHFGKALGWKPLLFFAQGVVYLAPPDAEIPERQELQDFIWQQISHLLGDKMSGGEIGFKRDGKGLKVAPQTLELFSYSQLIRLLPNIINARVTNSKDPATPKRLEKIKLSESERSLLEKGADIRSDQIAELIVFAQREFFENCPEFISWILQFLELNDKITPEKTQEQSGGVNYGWYYVAAYYIATHATLDAEQVSEKLLNLAENLAEWAENNNLLPGHHSPTLEIFNDYLTHYLEIQGWEPDPPSFNQELATYTLAKTKAGKQPICSLSSGEFTSEDQMDSVVLFKPQQYSNKNALGGGKIKRGISKIWALEMLLRQALWSAPAGKLEDQQPIFLYIFPAYVYAPQTAAAIGLLVNEIKRVNLWDIRKHWLEAGMDYKALRSLLWRQTDEVEKGRHSQQKYVSSELPFMATTYTTTRGKTLTDAWIEPAFLALSLPLFLGVKVVATSSSVPLYNSDRDFFESAILDGPAGFWTLLELPNTLRIQHFSGALQRLLIAYCLHLDNRSSPPDARWQAFNGTVREVVTDVLNVFALAQEGLRRNKRDRPTPEDVHHYWKFAQILATGDNKMQPEKLKIIERLVREYRTFYQVSTHDSSHAILLPISKALEIILTAPQQVDYQDLILQGAGQLKDALDRQKVYSRPLLLDKSIDYATRQANELHAIHGFMTTCVHDLFGKVYRYDPALLQENRNRIKSGAEFAYRWLALQEQPSETNA